MYNSQPFDTDWVRTTRAIFCLYLCCSTSPILDKQAANGQWRSTGLSGSQWPSFWFAIRVGQGYSRLAWAYFLLSPAVMISDTLVSRQTDAETRFHQSVWLVRLDCTYLIRQELELSPIWRASSWWFCGVVVRLVGLATSSHGFESMSCDTAGYFLR